MRQVLTLFALLQRNAHAPRFKQGRAASTGHPAIWDHRQHTNPVRFASSIRPDMIFGKDRASYRWQQPGRCQRRSPPQNKETYRIRTHAFSARARPAVIATRRWLREEYNYRLQVGRTNSNFSNDLKQEKFGSIDRQPHKVAGLLLGVFASNQGG